MVRIRLSAVCAVLAAAAWLAGCTTTPDDRTAGWSAQRLASEARQELDSGAWEKAIPLLEKLEGRAAGTVIAQQAQLDKAYAHYRNGEQAQAIATLDRFMRLHPASPAYDYALYLKGIVNFNENLGLFAWLSRQDLSERDQKAAKEAFETLRELVTRFPQSRYAQDASARMNYIVNSLAQYEVHVARYYLERGAYLAAVNRAQVAINDYRDVPALEEAMVILIRAYDALGQTQLRDDAKRVYQRSYPNSDMLRDGGRRIAQPWWKFW